MDKSARESVLAFNRSRRMMSRESHGFVVSYWFTKNSRQRLLKNGRVEVTSEFEMRQSMPF